jgi:hypothetical protein
MTRTATRTKTKTPKNGAATTSPKPKKTKSLVDLTIPPILLKTVKIKIKGTSSLIMNKFSAKAQKQIADKQQGKAKNKKAPKDPKAEFEAALYYMPGSKKKYGFPAAAFKKAAISACRYVDGVSMTHAKGAFHVLGDLVEIKIKGKPVMREDTVRIGGFGKKVADLRYRPEFRNWSCELIIRYNTNAITPEQIAHLLNLAGFAIGIGEWRPEREGSFGMFEVG